MKNRNQQFRELKEKYRLTSEDVAGMLECSYETVRSWLRSETSANYRTMPKTSLKLLLMLLDENSESNPHEESGTPS
mgnify:CR=1 FL=1